LNIGLNFVFIPLYGYLWAAITTLIAYLFLVFYFYLQDSLGFFKNNSFLKTINSAIAILMIMIASDRIIRHYYEPDVFQTIIEGILLLVVYVLIFRKKITSLKIPV